jgi:hypothetical protein
MIPSNPNAITTNATIISGISPLMSEGVIRVRSSSPVVVWLPPLPVGVGVVVVGVGVEVGLLTCILVSREAKVVYSYAVGLSVAWCESVVLP